MAGRSDGGDPRTVLEALLRQRDQTHEEFVAEFHAKAAEMSERATMSARHLRRLASGEASAPTPVTRRVLQAMFGRPFAELAKPWTPGSDLEAVMHGAVILAPSASPEETLRMAANRARKFALLAGQADLSGETLEQLADDVKYLCQTYPQKPLPLLLGDLVTTQDTLLSLLENRQRPQTASQLSLLAGVTGGLLAKASHDTGDPHSAMTQARTAFLCADAAGHDGLRAWIRGLESLIAYWAGNLRESVDYAQRGADAARAARSSSGVWLAVSEARAWAALGNAPAAREAIDNAERAWDTVTGDDELDQFGGIAAFSRPRALYYSAEALSWVPSQAGEARRYADMAVDAYRDEDSPDWAFGDASGSRASLAISRIHSGDLDGVAEVVEPVLELPPEQRMNGIIKSVQHVRDALVRSGRSGDSAVGDLEEQIEVFSRVPLKSLPR